MKQLELFGGGVLNRTDARVYLEFMLKMLRESKYANVSGNT